MIENIEKLKKEGAQLIIASFHWGIERENTPNETERLPLLIPLLNYACRPGAWTSSTCTSGNQKSTMEENILSTVWQISVFGGNSGPKDMDTMIFQQTFTFKDGKLPRKIM